jgi:tetratricopeptide (TPR) repeat protein
MYREALVAVEAAWGASSDTVSPILGNLALILSARGEIAEADSLFLRALAIDEAQFGPAHPVIALDKINLGSHFCENGREAEGLDHAADAVRILRSALDPGQWETGVAVSTHGFCLGKAHRFAEGERALLEAMEIVGAALREEHDRVARIRSRLADLYDAWGKPEQAREYRIGGRAPADISLHQAGRVQAQSPASPFQA